MKRLVALSLVLLLSIESFAAVVGDNDGAAFITKAEFDSLKSTFQEQINRYNQSIDNKIDGAIAGYLDGVRNDKTTMESLVTAGDWEVLDGSNLPRYKYGSPVLFGLVFRLSAGTSTAIDNKSYCQYAALDYSEKVADSTNKQNKLLISNLLDDETNASACWEGIGYGAVDYVQFLTHEIRKDAFSGITLSSYWVTIARAATGASSWDCYYHWEDTPLLGQLITKIFICGNAPPNSDAATSSTDLTVNKITHDWGDVKRKNMILLSGIAQETFSNMDNDRNWLYNGIDPWYGNEEKYETITTGGQRLQSYKNAFDTCRAVVTNRSGHSNYTYSYADKNWNATQLSYTLNASNGGYGGNVKVGDKVYKPCIGFEKKYINNWKQLYNSELDVIANEYTQSNYIGTTDLIKDKNGNYRVGLINGLPLIKLQPGEKLTVPLDFSNVSFDVNGNSTLTNHSDIYVWFKQAPFNTDDPDTEDCMDFENIPTGCLKGTGSFSKALKIPAGVSDPSVTLTAAETGYVWMKWSYANKEGGGMIHLPSQLKKQSGG